MSWRTITMKFDGTCIVCNKKVNANEIGLWSKGLGVKHEKCAEEANELKCVICDNPAGCLPSYVYVKNVRIRVIHSSNINQQSKISSIFDF